MSVSKGNELLQELYERLTGRWFNKGIYKGKAFTQEDVKRLLEDILGEYNKNDSANI